MNCHDIYYAKLKECDVPLMSTIETSNKIRRLLDKVSLDQLLEVYFDLKSFDIRYMTNILIGYINTWIETYPIRPGETLNKDVVFPHLASILFQPHLLLAHILRRSRASMVLTGPNTTEDGGLITIVRQAMRTALDVLARSIKANCFEMEKIKPRALKRMAMLFYVDVLRVFDLKANLLLFELDARIFSRAWMLDLYALGLASIANRIDIPSAEEKKKYPKRTVSTFQFPHEERTLEVCTYEATSFEEKLNPPIVVKSVTVTPTIQSKKDAPLDATMLAIQMPGEYNQEAGNWQSRYLEDFVSDPENMNAVIQDDVVDNASSSSSPEPTAEDNDRETDLLIHWNNMNVASREERDRRYPRALGTIPPIETNRIYQEGEIPDNRIAFELCDCRFVEGYILEQECIKCVRLSGVESTLSFMDKLRHLNVEQQKSGQVQVTQNPAQVQAKPNPGQVQVKQNPAPVQVKQNANEIVSYGEGCSRILFGSSHDKR